MLEAPGALLPRPMSLCLAPPRRARVPDRPDRARHAGALPRSSRATRSTCFGPLGNGFRLDVERPLLVGGGIGIAPLPYLVGGARAARRRSSASAAEWHAEAAALVPNAEVVDRPDPRHRRCSTAGRDVLACGPEPMLEAVRALAAGRAARLGGADGLRLRRLLRLRRSRSTATGSGSASKGRCSCCCLNASGCLDALTAPETRAAARRLRDEDGDAAAARRATRRCGSPRPTSGC